MLIVAHQHSQDIQSFLIDQMTGSISPSGYKVSVPNASCVKAVPNNYPIEFGEAE